MPIKLIDSIEPNGKFKLVDAEHIGITSKNKTYSLTDFLTACPEITLESLNTVGQDLTITANISSHTPGGCSVKFFITNIDGEPAIAPIVINNAIGSIAANAKLSIGEYKYYIEATNQNGTSRYPETGLAGPIRVGSIMTSGIAHFAKQFEKTFKVGSDNNISLAGLQLNFASAIKQLAIKFVLDNPAILTFNGLEDNAELSVLKDNNEQIIGISITKVFNTPIKAYNCLKSDSVHFTPSLSDGSAICSTKVNVEIEVVLADGTDTVLCAALPNYYTIAAMLHPTAAITDAQVITNDGDIAVSEADFIVSNITPIYLNVLGYTSSNDLRVTGFPIKITYTWKDGTENHEANFYPVQRIFHGKYSKVAIFAPETMRSNATGKHPVEIKVEPNVSDDYNKSAFSVTAETYHEYKTRQYIYERKQLLINFTPDSIDNTQKCIKNTLMADSLNNFASAKLSWEGAVEIDKTAETVVSEKDASQTTQKTIMRIPAETPLTLTYSTTSGVTSDRVLSTLLDAGDNIGTNADGTLIYGGAFTIDLCFKLPEDPQLTVFTVGKLFRLTGNKLYIADEATPIHLCSAQDGFCYLAFGYSTDTNLVSNTLSDTPLMVYLNGLLVYATRNVSQSSDLQFVLLPTDLNKSATTGLDLEYLRIYGAVPKEIVDKETDETSILKCICQPSTLETNYLASSVIAEDLEKTKTTTKIYFVGAPLPAGTRDYSDTGIFYKNVKQSDGSKVAVNYYRANFSSINAITKKNPADASEAASKNTFVPAHIIVEDTNGSTTLWASAGNMSNINAADCKVFLQGTSTLAYPVKNYQVQLSAAKKPPTKLEDKSWLADTVYTLKCDYMEQSHRNNTPTAKYYQDNIVPNVITANYISPALTIISDDSEDLMQKAPDKSLSKVLGYAPKYRDAIDGFPVEVYYIDETKSDVFDSLLAEGADLAYYLNNADKQLAGSYMWNIDKEGAQLGFEISKTNIAASFAEDEDLITTEDKASILAQKLKLRLDNASVGDLDLVIPDSEASVNINNLDFYLKGEYDSQANTLCGYSFEIDTASPPVYSSQNHCWTWSANTHSYKLQIASDILPCVSYEGGTNSNAAAAAFIPYSSVWERYLESAFETAGTLAGKEGINGQELRTFKYRKILTTDKEESYYSTVINAYNGQEEFEPAEADAITPAVSFSTFVDAIKSDYYKAYKADSGRTSTNTFAQKLVGVLSEPEFEESNGSNEIEYIEATLEPRFSYTDKHINVTFYIDDEVVSDTDDITEALQEYFKYKPIKQAINWIYEWYNKLFHSTDSYSIETFKSDFEKYFSKEYCLAYFLQMLVLAQVDNAGKNAMYDTWGDGRLYPRPYDMDTQMGLTNLGTDIVPSDVELSLEITGLFKKANLEVSNWAEVAGGKAGDRFSFYNTTESALWKCFYKAYQFEIVNLYKKCRENGGVYTFDRIMNYIDQCTSDVIKISLYNNDAINKYLTTSDKLYCISGNRRGRYASYLEERLKFLDTLWLATTEDPAILWLTANNDSYITVSVDSPQYISIYEDQQAEFPIAKLLVRPTDQYTQASTTHSGIKIGLNATALGTTGKKNVYIRGCKYVTGVGGFSSYRELEKLQLNAFASLKTLDFSNCKIFFDNATSFPQSIRSLNISASDSAMDDKVYCTGNLSIVSNIIEEIIASNSGISTLSVIPVGNNTCALSKLDLANTLQLETLSLSSCIKLNSIITNQDTACRANAIKLSVASGKTAKLKTLNLAYCSDLAITENTRLFSTIKDFNFTGCKALTGLSINNRTVNSLYLTGTKITYLNLSGAILRDLKLSNVTDNSAAILDFAQYLPNTLKTLKLTGASTVENCIIRLPKTTYDQLLLGRLLKVKTLTTADFGATFTSLPTDAIGTWNFDGITFNTSAIIPSGEVQFTLQAAASMEKLQKLTYSGSNVDRLLYDGDAASNAAYRCKELTTIIDCALTPTSTRLSYMFGYCTKLSTLTRFTIANLNLIKYADSMFLMAASLPYHYVESFVSQMSSLQDFSSGMYGYGSALSANFSMDLDKLFHRNAKSKIISVGNAFNGARKLQTVTGTLPTEITSLERSFYHCTELTNVQADIIASCTAITTLANAFNGCENLINTIELPCGYSVEKTSQIKSISGMYTGCKALTLGGDAENMPSFYQAFTAGVKNYTGQTEETTSIQVKAALENVTYADCVFKDCKALNANLENFLDYLPSVQYMDGMFSNSGIKVLPTKLATLENNNILTCRGLFSRLTLDAPANGTILRINEDWLSSAMPKVRYIGATHYPRTYNNTLDNIASSSSMLDSTGLTISLQQEDLDSRIEDEYNDYKADCEAIGKDDYEATSAIYYVNKHNVGWPTSSSTLNRTRLPGILAGTTVSNTAIKLQVPITIFNGLADLRDCSFALACLPINSDSNDELELSLTTETGVSKATKAIQLIKAPSSAATTLFSSPFLKNIAYCFAGCLSDLEEIPNLISNTTDYSTLNCAAGFFAASTFSFLKIKNLYDCIFSPITSFTNLTNLENLYNLSTVTGSTAETDKIFTANLSLPTPKLAYAAGMFANIRSSTSQAVFYEETLPVTLFDKCRSELKSVRGCFYSAEGLIGLSEGSYSYYPKVPYASSDTETTTEMSKWFNDNKIFGLTADLVNNLTYNASTKLVEYRTDIEGQIVYSSYSDKPPRATAEDQLWFIIDGRIDSDGKRWITFEKSVADEGSGKYIWTSMNHPDINQVDSAGAVLVLIDVEIEGMPSKQLKLYTADDLATDQNNFITASTNATLPSLIEFDYQSLLTRNKLISAREYYLSPSLMTTTINSYGIFGNCSALEDASFCFSQCTDLKTKIPRDLFYNSNSLRSIRGVFAYCTNMYAANQTSTSAFSINVRFDAADSGKDYSIPLTTASKCGSIRTVYPAVYKVTQDLIAFVDTAEAEKDFYFIPDDWITSTKLNDIAFAFLSVGYSRYSAIELGDGEAIIQVVRNNSLDFSGKIITNNTVVRADYAFAHCKVFANANIGKATTAQELALFAQSSNTLKSADSMFEASRVSGLYIFDKTKTYSSLTKFAQLAYGIEMTAGKLTNTNLIDKCVLSDEDVSNATLFPRVAGGASNLYQHCCYGMIDSNTDGYSATCNMRTGGYDSNGFATESNDVTKSHGFTYVTSLAIKI